MSQQGILDTASLPQGGGGLRGLGEKFSSNPATGTVGFSLPLPQSSPRALPPNLQLSYDSGNSASFFGLGWGVPIRSIQRRVSQSIPTYSDAEDVFTFVTGEEFVPHRDDARTVITDDRINYAVYRYRTRVERGHSRIEHWRPLDGSPSHWRVWDSDNVVSLFGLDPDSRVAQPDTPEHVFEWKLQRRFDTLGNVIEFHYKSESGGTSVLYPKRVFYGNTLPYRGSGLAPEAFAFSLVFDYGEHTGEIPGHTEAQTWSTRPDPFRRGRAGFEQVWRRRCDRVIAFHNFAELGAEPVAVRALEFGYQTNDAGLSELITARQVGFDPAVPVLADRIKATPELRFTYQRTDWGGSVQSLRNTTGDPMRVPTSEAQETWIDLWAEGIPGLLTQSGSALHFQRNLGGGVLADAQAMPKSGNVGTLGQTLTPASVDGSQRRYLRAAFDGIDSVYNATDILDSETAVVLSRRARVSGDFGAWRPIDITGDGLPDKLASDGERLTWVPSDGLSGDKAPRTTKLAIGAGTRWLSYTDQATVFLSDMSGDGLSDIVRIRRGSVSYWPNLGYGRFGAEVAMADAPSFDRPDQFDLSRIYLADFDGSGTSDIAYYTRGKLTIWLNRGGAGWTAPVELDVALPAMPAPEEVQFADILGKGVAQLVWLGPDGVTKYAEIVGAKKPYLLAEVDNAMGGINRFSYLPSTYYYLQDRDAGRPWLTRLPFPVHCLSSAETEDRITGLKATQTYSYHHGWFDPDDREFRGFARVDRYDLETVDDATNRVYTQPQHLTRTWYHTGAEKEGRDLLQGLDAEFYSTDALKMPSAWSALPGGLSALERRDAIHALRGSVLRSETYALDGTEAQNHPYSVAITHHSLIKRQARGASDRSRLRDWAVFQMLEEESFSITLDRNPDDPRLSHDLVLARDAFGQPVSTASLAYGRGLVDANAPAAVVAAQTATRMIVTEVTMTQDQLTPSGPVPLSLLSEDRVHRLPKVCESRVSEVTGLQTSGDWIEVAELADFLSTLPSRDYAVPADLDTPAKRLISHSRSFFWNDTLTDALPLGEAGLLRLSHHTEQLAFTSALLTSLYGDKVSAADLARAGYVEGDDGTYWVASGTAIFPADTADRFFIPVGARDVFGFESWQKTDAYGLLPISSTDALGHQVLAKNDYRVMAPKLVRDANHNWSAVAHDALGYVVATAAMGKVDGGDPETGRESAEADNLDHPSAFMSYDLFAWSRDGASVRVTQTTYEEFFFSTPERTKTQVSHSYFNGFGETVLTKAQAKPGPALRLEPSGLVETVDAAERWVATGRTVFNNKGAPLRQFEPYFSDNDGYETGDGLDDLGASGWQFYDAADRAIGALAADKSWQKVQITPWKTVTWDAGDLADIADPALDEDLGAHFSSLSLNSHAPSWAAERVDQQLGEDARRAAELSLDYAGTPSTQFSDVLGRTICEVGDNGAFGKITSLTALDIEGNLVSVTDGRGNLAVRNHHNLLPPPDEETPKPVLHAESMDSGENWVFQDALGRLMLAWDARGFRSETTYDGLGRPVTVEVTYPTWAAPKRVAVTEYGDAHEDAIARNLIGRVWRSWDQSGLSETRRVSLTGQPLETRRQLVRPDLDPVDWPEDAVDRTALLEPEAFLAETSYDALDRVIHAIAPYPEPATPGAAPPLNQTRLHYDTGGVLARIEVSVRGVPYSDFVEELDYDAKGQRTWIRYGNQVTTSYEHDPLSYRLTRMTAISDSDVLQDIVYTYDITGQITTKRDHAQQAVYFRNDVVEPLAEYRYDPLGRLREANGREHIDQNGAPDWQIAGLIRSHPEDGQRMRRYSQIYDYDAGGNLILMRHIAPGGQWTRHFEYDQASNRLKATRLGAADAPVESRFEHNANGSLTELGHLSALGWNFAEQLVSLDTGAGETALYTYGSDGQRVRKLRRFPGGRETERLYLGGVEIYRERINGVLQKERESLHVMEGESRIALVETLTVENGAPVASPEPLVRYQMGDHLGSATLELDDGAQVISYDEYHPYGTLAYRAVNGQRAPPAKRYGYTGKERDEESGFSYHGARYYMPWLARWTSADPAGMVDGPNLYAYVRGNPISYVDQTGKWAQLLLAPLLLLPNVAEAPTKPDYQGFQSHLLEFSPKTVTRSEDGLNYTIEIDLVIIENKKLDARLKSLGYTYSDLEQTVKDELYQAYTGSSFDYETNQKTQWTIETQTRVTSDEMDVGPGEIQVVFGTIDIESSHGVVVGVASQGGRQVTIDVDKIENRPLPGGGKALSVKRTLEHKSGILLAWTTPFRK
ncbi:SpvB/TcaC N-terminal domain-containing protein [Roseovarius sp. E0-M6]|uniref:SpvB/TcaC N-terminal domain-containing protein n=1 Tax=Roseovarius sp. E0-M6 TaxID=3127118 RepID=UPI00300FE10E